MTNLGQNLKFIMIQSAIIIEETLWKKHWPDLGILLDVGKLTASSKIHGHGLMRSSWLKGEQCSRPLKRRDHWETETKKGRWRESWGKEEVISLHDFSGISCCLWSPKPNNILGNETWKEREKWGALNWDWNERDVYTAGPRSQHIPLKKKNLNVTWGS